MVYNLIRDWLAPRYSLERLSYWLVTNIKRSGFKFHMDSTVFKFLSYLGDWNYWLLKYLTKIFLTTDNDIDRAEWHVLIISWNNKYNKWDWFAYFNFSMMTHHSVDVDNVKAVVIH